MYAMNVPQFACQGLNFGYYYDNSPIIHYDGEAPPAYEMGRATESTVPGCRLPHFWMSEGKSIYDELGPVYTLLCFNGFPAEVAFSEAFEKAALPLKALIVDSQPDVYATNYVLARTDQHVAWRGDVLPENADDFVAVCASRSNA